MEIYVNQEILHVCPFGSNCYFQAFDLAIDESSFTGETEPAGKTVEICTAAKLNGNVSHLNNIAFMGTLVRCGNGKVGVAEYIASGTSPQK